MAKAPEKRRVIGVDVARGMAVILMIGHHTFSNSTLSDTIAGGRAPASFILLAGVGMALMSGGRRPVEGRARAATRAGLFVRGLLVLAIGLALAYPDGDQLDVILAFFGLFFIFAIPLLGLRPSVLWKVALGIALLYPVVFHLIADHLPAPPYDTNPDFGTLIHHPSSLLVALCFTGFYPVLPWMAVICAGVAAGRLQLSSPRVAARLLVGGLALAAAAWGVSFLLLHPLGGLHDLLTSIPKNAGMSSADVRDLATSGGGNLPTWSWWWLGIAAGHTQAPLDLLHVMGCALALLGGMLLLTRVAIFARVLTPVALAGGMGLTIYSTHAAMQFLLPDEVGWRAWAQFAVQIALALAFAVVWRRRFARGPLETLLAAATRRAQRAVMSGPGRLATPRRASSTAQVQPIRSA